MKKDDMNILGKKIIDGGTYNDINVLGELQVLNDLFVQEIDVLGKLKIEGKLNAKEINILGEAIAMDNIKVDTLNVIGKLNIKGNLEGEKIEIIGIIHSSADINADTIKVLPGESTFNNIYGDKVIFQKESDKTKNINMKNQQNQVELIEATKIILNNVKVKKVSGSNIEVGKNVEIDILEYSDSLILSRECKINKIIKF